MIQYSEQKCRNKRVAYGLIDHEQTCVYIKSFAFCQNLGTFTRLKLKPSCMSAT